MSRFLDARVPVCFAAPGAEGVDVAWLAQDDTPIPADAAFARFSLPAARAGHPASCACCVPRGPVADALSRLFLARVRGEVAFFRAVAVATRDEAGVAAVRAALTSDPLLLARFRLVD